MADKPIIFSTPMVRALLAGHKTQTRRIAAPFAYDRSPLHPGMKGYRPAPINLWQVDHGGPYFLPRYSVGDRLYVREHWRTADAYDDLSPSQMGGEEPVIYLADDTLETWGWRNDFVPGRFRQAMHMPRWASRITLTVTDVRVQRLQEISGEDCLAEGVQCATCDAMKASACHGRGCFASIDAYRTLWNSLHGPGAWEANPWVAAYSFTVQRGNIDRLQGDPQ